VRFALHRIEDGTYGVCLSCDGQISEKRLNAMPWANYCLACQEGFDQGWDQQETLLAAS
jgi:DnaK suppressor protein